MRHHESTKKASILPMQNAKLLKNCTEKEYLFPKLLIYSRFIAPPFTENFSEAASLILTLS